MVSIPQSQWTNWISTRDISVEHKALVEEAASQLLAILAGWSDYAVYPNFRLRMKDGKTPRRSKLRPGLYPECEIDRGQGQHGYIDLMIVKADGMIVILDWKMVRSEGHDYTLQLGAYACEVNRICPKHDTFECRIVAPRLPTDSVETYLWGKEDLDALRARIQKIETIADQSANDESVVGCPSDACTYCHWAGKCQYQARAAVQAVDALDVTQLMTRGTEYEGETLSRETFTAPATPAQRGLRRAFIKFFKSAVEQWTDDDKTWVAMNKGSSVPGWKISWRNGRASLDKTRMTEIRDAIISKIGLTEDDVDMVSVVDLTLLKGFLVENLGYTEKSASQEIQSALDSLMTTGAPYSVWTQSKAKEVAARVAIEV